MQVCGHAVVALTTMHARRTQTVTHSVQSVAVPCNTDTDAAVKDACTHQPTKSQGQTPTTNKRCSHLSSACCLEVNINTGPDDASEQDGDPL